MTGLRMDDDGIHLAVFMGIMILLQFVVVSFGWLAVALVRDFSQASLLANSVYTFMGLACGFFINLDSLPVYIRWIQPISFVYWPLEALSANEFRNHRYTCPFPASSPECQFFDGNYVLEKSLSFEDAGTTWPAIWILVMIAFYSTLTMLALLIPRDPMVMARPVVHRKDRIANVAVAVEEKQASIPENTQPLNLRIDKLSLKTSKNDLLGHSQSMTILDDLSANFAAGEFVMILGGSGCGAFDLRIVVNIRQINAFEYIGESVDGGITNA
jgi:ABC-type multidrug transport system fused ATPase/permease subunit